MQYYAITSLLYNTMQSPVFNTIPYNLQSLVFNYTIFSLNFPTVVHTVNISDEDSSWWVITQNILFNGINLIHNKNFLIKAAPLMSAPTWMNSRSISQPEHERVAFQPDTFDVVVTCLVPPRPHNLTIKKKCFI